MARPLEQQKPAWDEIAVDLDIDITSAGEWGEIDGDPETAQEQTSAYAFFTRLETNIKLKRYDPVTPEIVWAEYDRFQYNEVEQNESEQPEPFTLHHTLAIGQRVHYSLRESNIDDSVVRHLIGVLQEMQHKS